MMGGEGSQRRGQSEVLGVVLLFGIVLSMSVLVVVAGGAVMDASQDSVSAEGAAVSMSELDGTVSSMERRTDGSASASFEGFSGDGTVDVRRDSTMRIVVAEEDGTHAVDENVTLGAVVYERGDEEVAYEGGGVWRKQVGSDASRNVSPPQFEYRYDTGDPTLTLPLVTVTGSAGGDDLSLRQTSASTTMLPGGSTAVNPLDDGESVQLTVHSDYYRAWGAFFADRTDGGVTYDHANRNVTLTLRGLSSTSDPTSGSLPGALSTSDVTELGFDNDAKTGSYDSSGPPWNFDGDQGDVYVRGRFDPTGDRVNVSGDLYVEDASPMDNNPDASPQVVMGDAVYGDGGSAGRTDVLGNHYVAGNLSIGSDAEIRGATWARNVTVGNHLLVGGDLVNSVSEPAFARANVSGDVRVRGDVTEMEDVTVGDDLLVNGDVSNMSRSEVGGDVRVDGDVGTLDARSVDGDVHVGGDVENGSSVTVDGNVTIDGNLTRFSATPSDPFHVTGDLRVNGNLGEYDSDEVEVDGDIVVGGSRPRSIPTCPTVCPHPYPIDSEDPDDIPDAEPADIDAVGGPTTPTFPSMGSLNGNISDMQTKLEDDADNDNDDHPNVIDALEDSSEHCRPQCVLTSGQYYVEDGIDLGNEKLIFDTTDGAIEVYAEPGANGGLRVANSNVTVRGDAPVHFYNGGDFRIVEQDGTGLQAQVVTRPTPYQAENFRLYMRSDKTAALNNEDTVFTGVIDGPGDPDGTSITLTNDATVYGALVGEFTDVNRHAEVYFDESLGGGSPDTTRIIDSDGSQVRFVHVTTRTVEVSG